MKSRIILLLSMVLALNIGVSPARGAVSVAENLPSDADLARMSESELVDGFREAHSLHTWLKSFGPCESYVWALRLRFPDSPDLPAIECRLALDQLFSNYGDQVAALAGLKRFLPDGPYAGRAPETYWARLEVATELALDGNPDEAAEICRQSVLQNAGGLENPRWILETLQLLFDLRLLRGEDAAVGDLFFCQTELQRLFDSATAEVNRWPLTTDDEAAPMLKNARRVCVVAPRRVMDCLDSRAPQEDAARLRADLSSYDRMGYRSLSHRKPEKLTRTYFTKAAELGREWVDYPLDSDLIRNLQAMRHAAMAAVRYDMSPEAQTLAYSLMNTIWSHRDDPEAEDADPWMAGSWLMAIGNNLRRGREESEGICREALVRGRRLAPETYQGLFTNMMTWASQDNNADEAALLALDFADLVGPREEYQRIYPKARAMRLKIEAESPELVERLAGQHSEIYYGMLNNGAFDAVDGQWYLPTRKLWGPGNEGEWE